VIEVEGSRIMRMEVEFVKHRRSIWVFTAKATVDGQVAAQADIMCTSREI
jgi:3-hydroxyacyl-[acyl-carrier-protein] dehydratase